MLTQDLCPDAEAALFSNLGLVEQAFLVVEPTQLLVHRVYQVDLTPSESDWRVGEQCKYLKSVLWILGILVRIRIQFFLITFLKVHLHQSSKIKSHKEVTKQ
jgi:hypothetical protein